MNRRCSELLRLLCIIKGYFTSLSINFSPLKDNISDLLYGELERNLYCSKYSTKYFIRPLYFSVLIARFKAMLKMRARFWYWSSAEKTFNILHCTKTNKIREKQSNGDYSNQYGSTYKSLQLFCLSCKRWKSRLTSFYHNIISLPGES